MDGIADHVKIMAVRCVPDGDERDKDVANAIIYAVDNGASVINMSFGKGYAWDKTAVDKAVKYARKHDVLLVHAAGNSSQDNDNTDNFPNDKYAKHGLFGAKKAKNWIEVGALSWKGGEDAAASFSNYGKENVDLFAPGVAIYSTVPDNGYAKYNGTSMASPVVAGVAAEIRSYYPNLTAEQVKDVLMSTTVRAKDADKVKKPGGDGELVPFTDLSVTGGVVNVYEAMKKADTIKGKKKSSKYGRSGSSNGGNGKNGKKGRA
jgi:subtilisin family serine protease